MTASAIIQVEGHIIDSLILAKILDVIVEAGAEYQLLDIDVGKSHTDASYARIELRCETEEATSISRSVRSTTAERSSFRRLGMNTAARSSERSCPSRSH